jgi:hypothetical protein
MFKVIILNLAFIEVVRKEGANLPVLWSKAWSIGSVKFDYTFSTILSI